MSLSQDNDECFVVITGSYILLVQPGTFGPRHHKQWSPERPLAEVELYKLLFLPTDTSVCAQERDTD